jgi:hypothetical protein
MRSLRKVYKMDAWWGHRVCPSACFISENIQQILMKFDLGCLQETLFDELKFVSYRSNMFYIKLKSNIPILLKKNH